MLPDKNELNNETIEQISGGEDCQIKTGRKDEATQSKGGVFFYTCPNCGNKYSAYEKRTDGFCPNCEPKPLEVSIPTGDMQTTIPSNNKNAFKIH